MTTFAASHVPLNAQASANLAKAAVNLPEFTAAMRRASRDMLEGECTVFLRRIGLELLRRIVLRTPVDEGPLRHNWQVTIGQPAPSPRSGSDVSGSATIAEGSAVVNKAKLGQVIWITNNLRYAPIVEFGGFVPPDPGPTSDPRPHRYGRVWVRGGYSVQAPRGMLMVSVAEVEAMFP